MKKNFGPYWNQLRAMLLRNIILKKREKRKTLAEVLLPLYSFVVLAILKTSIPNPNFPSIMDPKSYDVRVFDNFSIYQNQTIAVIPNTTEVQVFVSNMSELWDGMRKNNGIKLHFEYLETKEDLQELYWYEPLTFAAAIIFSNNEPISNPYLEYEIKANPTFTSTPTTAELYSSPLSCRENSHIFVKALENSRVLEVEDCPAYRYFASGFITLQMLIDYTKIKIDSEKTFQLPMVKLKLFPKEAHTADWMWLFRLVIPAYLVMSLSQFVTYLLMLIVSEKENKIRESMKIMGLRDSVFWLSWFILYSAFVLIMSIVATACMFGLGVFQHSNIFLIFLLILLYGFSIIFFSFMLTPFFNNARSAGILGNFIINILSLLYVIRVFVSKTKPEFLWIMSLLSPPGFTLAMDKALTMDMSGNGIRFENLWSGPGLSFGCSLLMLCFDNLLYAVLAYYLDLVIPSEYGAKRKPWFILFPICNLFKSLCIKKTCSRPKDYITAENTNNDDIESVPNSMKDKVGIEIVNLHKHFSSCGKQQVSALNGINLKIYEGQITAILGHNGAGKTTLFNILTGMTKPTSGTAYIFGHDIRDPIELNKVRKMFGVCPQQDILFDNLTPREHLKLFSAVRGILNSDQNLEIERTLKCIDLEDKADVCSKYLSGGQKRKLSVGIAIIGSPKVIILDEPTAGVDPYSRRYMWSIFQQHKVGKVILLTTHFMDEADILADRKAVISKGQLRCVGSSLFLKNKFGIGYHLTLVLDNVNLEADIISFVRHYVPEAEHARRHGKELSLILPHHSVGKFAALFTELEKEVCQFDNRFGINSYGISMTTLEEVFLYLERNDELEEGEGTIAKKIVKKRIFDNSSRSLRRRRISSNSMTLSSQETNNESIGEIPMENQFIGGLGMEAIKVNPNCFQISRALMKLRILSIYRDPCKFLLIVFVPLIFSIFGMYFNFRTIEDQKMKPLILDKDLYDEGRLVVFEHNNILNFTKHLNIDYDFMVGNISSILLKKPHVGAIEIHNCCDPMNITVYYNDTTMHSLPLILNVVNNALYSWHLIGETKGTRALFNNKIVAKTYPFVMKSQPEEFDFSIVSTAVCLGAALVVVPILFATEIVYDREIHAKNLLRINGLSFWSYYVTYFGVLSLAMLMILILHLGSILVFDMPAFVQPVAFTSLAFMLLVYAPCSILFATCVSFAFNKAETAQSILLNSASFVGLLPFMIVLLLDMIKIDLTWMLLIHSFFSFLDTFYLPFVIVYFVGRVYLSCLANEACTYITLWDYFTPEIIIILAACFVQIPFLLFMLKLLEHLRCGGTLNSYFLSKKQKNGSENDRLNMLQIPNDENDNEDVKFERYRVAHLITSTLDSPDHPVVILQNLTKDYNERNEDDGCCNKIVPCTKPIMVKNSSKLAVNKLSFLVGPGEIFGLLGHAGAGKTTTMRLITSEIMATNGRMQLKGINVECNNLKDVYKILGYCPQNDILWKNITVKEHIEIYAAIRGVPVKTINEITDVYLSALQIREHGDKKSYQCSGGTKRKLSFAIAMVGNPDVVLMDEPSVGMDPHSKRFLWDTILASFQGARGAVLATHSMEEADALCTRVGILVNGKLRCIGSTQHLKNLYGAGYTLEVKFITEDDENRRAGNEETFKQYVNDLFPLATLEETFSDHLVFSIPQSSVASLSNCFSYLESAKDRFSIEEYSFSQTTLEQVFLKFAHSEEESTCQESTGE